jgi:hypothetical protein
LLAEAASARWRALPLAHAPGHFRVVAWKDSATVWGLAGCNPVELRVDAPRFTAWDVQSCGGIAPAPDDSRLAWSDGQGGIRVGVRGAEPEQLLAPGTPPPAGEGDPTGLIRWSPDGSRILTSWAVEWNSDYGIVSLASGVLTPMATRLDGYYLTEAWDWLDDDRILFRLQAVRDLQGRSSQYSESGGVRADLAVASLPDSTFARVTSVPDGVMLEALGRWGGREILVGERSRTSAVHERYWAYDLNGWSRRAIPLPAGHDVLVFDTTRVLILERDGGGGGVVRARAFLWSSEENRVEPLVELREGSLAWSPDGRRLALSTTVDEPVAGAPGSFRTRSLVYVLEPR